MIDLEPNLILTILIWFIGIAIGFIALMAIFYLAAVWLEKRSILSPVSTTPPVEETLHKYLKTKISEAKDLGFEACGWYRTIDFGNFRGIATLWRSINNLELMIIASGKTIGIPQNETIIYSQSDGDVIIVTSDKTPEKDLSGQTVQSYIEKGSLTDLLNQHRQVINGNGFTLKEFNSDDLPGETIRIEKKRVNALEKCGYIRFVNPGRTIYKYTFIGGLKQFKEGFLVQMIESFRKGKKQKLEKQ